MRELQALVAPKPPQGVLVRGHAGLVINQLSLTGDGGGGRGPQGDPHHPPEREFFIDNLLVRIRFIIEIIWWTGV